MSDTRVLGKFLEVAGQRFLVRGVSYGTFAPASDGTQFPTLERVSRDFEAIAALGANTVRCYTPPPKAVMDCASEHRLRVMVGLPWPQHIAFLERRQTAREIRASIREGVRRLAGHPASLLFAVGNEIPATVVRWYGRLRIERFLRELFEEAKGAAPDALVTYVNYPPTEYVDVSCFDVCAFNVFVHHEAGLRGYLAHLHHLAGPRPLLVAEAGVDSARLGEERQAGLVAMQVRTAFREGACGAVVFGWTDEWWRGGRSVDDWAFGLVGAARQPKLAHRAVQRVFQSVPFRQHDRAAWPRISVVVCAYNAESVMDECLTSLDNLTYPDVEVIVVNDGSTDGTRSIAARHPRARIIDIENSGLATARNVGLEAATGQIVAYTDADVRVDPDWLTYLVQPFITSDVVAAGGPNVVPENDPWMAQVVARSPGAPTHVLIDERVAEHVPGCNCAFRREALLAIGGFNPRFLRAGDDVDVCWRLLARRWRIGFAPAALVWHHHRDSIRAYIRQQAGYGEGEAWLIDEHPDRFVKGSPVWRGHIYSPLPFVRSLSAVHVNAGPFGSAAFPSVYRTDAHPFAFMPHSGRWQVAWILLYALAALVAPIRRSLAGGLLSLGFVAMLATHIKCLVHGWRSDLTGLRPIGRLPAAASRVVYRLAIAALHFLQPFARIWGRLRGTLSMGGRTGARSLGLPLPSRFSARAAALGVVRGCRLLLFGSIDTRFWTTGWADFHVLLHDLAGRLRSQRAVRQVQLDAGWWEDRDLSAIDRAWFRLDLRTLLEDYGADGCVYRFRTRLRFTRAAWISVAAMALVAVVVPRVSGIDWRLGAIVASVATAVLAVRAVARTAGTVVDALHAMAAGRGMRPLAGEPERPRALRTWPDQGSDVKPVLVGPPQATLAFSGLAAGWRAPAPPALELLNPANDVGDGAPRTVAAGRSREL